MNLAAVSATGLVLLGGTLLGGALAGSTVADARSRNNDKRIENSLRSLDPETRFHQVCDMAAMQHIGKDKTYKPDRAVIDAVSEAAVKGDSMTGEGGAFRSRGKWYQFAFTCAASPDRMKVETFTFKIGPEIPENKYEAYNLWE